MNKDGAVLEKQSGSKTAFLREELDKLKAQNLWWTLRVHQSPQAARVKVDGRQVISLASNNYLGLTNHPKLKNAAIQAIKKYGVGSGAVRPIAGTMAIHEELEKKLASFKYAEASLVFQSGYISNVAVVSTVMGEGDLILSDQLNHASIIDGARVTKAERKVYGHCDVAALEQLLKEAQGKYRRILVVTDSVFSMDGDIAPLKELAALAKRYGALFMVDDAHGSGVLGKQGRGAVNHFGLEGQVDIQIGTLSKAIGAMGGYVVGSRDLREYMIQKARPFLFSTSHPPSVAATCLAAIEVMQKEPKWLKQLWENTKFFQGELKRMGFNIGKTQTPLTPVIAGDPKKAQQLSAQLWKQGIFVQAIVFPMVAREQSRVRAIVTGGHTKQDLTKCLEAFKKSGRSLGLIS